MKIPLSAIVRDESLQVRSSGTSRELVREYVEARKRGVVLPAVLLFVDEQGRYWIGDGWHRIEAADSLALSGGESEIDAEVKPGGRRAAFLHALGANDAHGARRTRKDKLNAIRQALLDPEIRQQSDRMIATMCGVDHKTVGKVRGQESEGALFDASRRGSDRKIRRTARRVGISPVGENVAFGSSLGGAGVGERRNEESAQCSVLSAEKGGAMEDGRSQMEKGAAATWADEFNVVKAMRSLEGGLAAEFMRWPEEKRHAFCVAAANFAKLHDPEIAARTNDALDELLVKKAVAPADDGKERARG